MDYIRKLAHPDFEIVISSFTIKVDMRMLYQIKAKIHFLLEQSSYHPRIHKIVNSLIVSSKITGYCQLTKIGIIQG